MSFNMIHVFKDAQHGTYCTQDYKSRSIMNIPSREVNTKPLIITLIVYDIKIIYNYHSSCKL